MQTSRFAMVAGIFAVCASAPVSAEVRVLVWPESPGVFTAGTDEAVRAAGHEPVPTEPVLAALQAGALSDAEVEGRALSAIETSLGAVRKHYLAQRFADMENEAEGALDSFMLVLGGSKYKETLWEFAFQAGLAHFLQNDTLHAEWFDFALAIDAARRPERAVYGPRVAAAYADAVANQSTRPGRLVALKLRPSGARLWLNGTPVVDLGAGITVKPGRQLLLARAPGYAPIARLVDTRSGVLEIELKPQAASLAGLGADWQEGRLSPPNLLNTAAIAAAAQEVNASAVVFVAASAGGFTGYLIARGQTVAGPPRASAADAVSVALAALGQRGVVEPAALQASPKTSDGRSIFKRWWFWTGIGVVAGTTAVILLTRPDKEDRLEVTIR